MEKLEKFKFWLKKEIKKKKKEAITALEESDIAKHIQIDSEIDVYEELVKKIKELEDE